MAAHAVKRRMTLFGMNGFKMRSMKKVLPSTDVHFMVGKKLAERLWLPDLQAATLDVNSSQLKMIARQTSEALGTECRLLSIHMLTGKGKASHVSCRVPAACVLRIADSLIVSRSS